MADIEMCARNDCPNQDNCWRLNAPPNIPNQYYKMFDFDYEAFESGDSKNGCDFYIAMDELDFS